MSKHLMVNALAGTGKTTTAMWGLGIRPGKGVELSDEQKRIVKSMKRRKWKKAAVMAFNVSIAEELKRRVPRGCEAATCNAFGHRVLCNARGRVEVEKRKNRMLFKELYPKLKFHERLRSEPVVDKLVGLLKGCLGADGYTWEDPCSAMLALARRYGVELNDVSEVEMAARVFQKSVEVLDIIDYNDQLFLPIYLNLDMPKFDLVVVDEAQDLNRAKQVLAQRMGEQVVVIGDRHQSIYGFSGADPTSMDTLHGMLDEDEGCEELELTYTRRCSREAVRMANKYVPELKAHEDNLEGKVLSADDGTFFQDLKGDTEGEVMVLCRINAPLTGMAFKLLKEGRRCYIQGRDIGVGLKMELEKYGERDYTRAVSKAVQDMNDKLFMESSQTFPCEDKIQTITDRRDCIYTIANECKNFEEYRAKIDSLFLDSGKPGDIRLSSVHKSKGLEADRVWIYCPEKLPFAPLMKGWQAQQELNLAYVAYTRTKDVLGFVDGGKESEDQTCLSLQEQQ